MTTHRLRRLIPAALLALAAPALAGPALPALDGHQLKLAGPVVFETGGDKLRPESDGPLEQVRAYLEAKSYISLLRIEQHADNQGDPRAAQGLSERRALAVAKALVARGIDCKRLLPVGFGGSKPVADNGTPEGRAQNRRTVFANAALRGHAIGGMPVDGGGQRAGDPCK